MVNQTCSARPPIPQHLAKFEGLAYGMFLHYGLYSQLGRGEWAVVKEPMSVEEYAQLIRTFTAEKFDGRAIAALAAESGMRYATLTARHMDGFSLYDTKGLSQYDAPHSPAGRDLVEDFVEGCRELGIVPFLYHTTIDISQNSHERSAESFDEYLDYLFDSIEVLCENYGELGGLWFDGNWSRTDVDWREDELYGRIRKRQPNAVLMNNSGIHALGAKTHPQLDAVTFERGTPRRTTFSSGERYVSAEMCQTSCQHWGHAADDFQHRSPASIIRDLCDCRGAGANLLFNVGPLGDGSIGLLDEQIIRRVGQWVHKYESILRNGRPTDATCDGSNFVLRADGKLYLFAYDLPCKGDPNVVKGDGRAGTCAIRHLDEEIRSARWLDCEEPMQVTPIVEGGGSHSVRINLTPYPYGKDLVVRVAELTPER